MGTGKGMDCVRDTGVNPGGHSETREDENAPWCTLHMTGAEHRQSQEMEQANEYVVCYQMAGDSVWCRMGTDDANRTGTSS